MHGSQATAKARPAITGPPVAAREMSASGRHWRFSRGMNIVAMKRTPITAITIPLTCLSVTRCSPSQWPIPVAPMPSATNMIVNERQKISAGPSTFALPLPSFSSANEMPEIADR